MEVEEETLPGLEHILPDGTILPDDSRPVVVSVVLDSSECKGVRVEVDERRVDRFEEVVRRGGIVTLPSRVREWLAEVLCYCLRFVCEARLVRTPDK